MSGGIRGIYTVADLMDRCYVDEVSGCWHWRQATDPNGYPSVWMPALQQRCTLATAICWLVTGKRPDKGVIWRTTCRTTGCANPMHRAPGTRSEQMLTARCVRDPAQRARIAAGKRATSKLSQADCAAIRQSEEPLRVLVERYGVGKSHISRIRRGEARRELGARGASVFNLGGF